MDRSEILEKIKGIIKPYCKKEDVLKNATEQTKFLDDLEINSARLVDIILAFEDEFDIEISDDEADAIVTTGNVIDLILRKKS